MLMKSSRFHSMDLLERKVALLRWEA
ncbi:hypothetical protein Goari_004807 [Gossypium aridum]|uniref:Uncharacterized protein n=1 Tax=Gossypium aridum TaxID=34290 RepID=A0A7J8Y4L2_GOSAI|nr:hypothetical protein [Gossypium aridum]